ncbi:2-dehydro-3-deoxy-6-phosphogalactonate aldolase [Pseudacidovorax intermedius]|uniref:2-dehydro-3-deoxy-6-phosphogalactonate aldolase n=1 Tax=Pseudacidovorax intermedius TaxID=433924 RepID=A0A147GLK2_9BURK|nr:2-dehydro-3-deoxy-6-phosphogalactonate aldolase [Pseudacidovorax intermedius]KTT14465.1 2-dehydro-3-deoxy-6-phosphogalactonate aldolase [Pseudacidovorax intermedius]
MTDLLPAFQRALAQLPLVAILRGLTPAEAPAIGQALVASDFGLLEVPLNSPEPLESIHLLRDQCPGALVGAGTVLTPQQVREVHAAGGQLIVSPCFDAAVVRETVALGMVALPGVLTPTEAFGALAAGAHALKLFPAEMASPAAVKALKAVLPRGTPLLPVGGITPEGMPAWHAAGADGFGIGSALYKSGKAAEAVETTAREFVAAWRRLAG